MLFQGPPNGIKPQNRINSNADIKNPIKNKLHYLRSQKFFEVVRSKSDME